MSLVSSYTPWYRKRPVAWNGLIKYLSNTTIIFYFSCNPSYKPFSVILEKGSVLWMDWSFFSSNYQLISHQRLENQKAHLSPGLSVAIWSNFGKSILHVNFDIPQKLLSNHILPTIIYLLRVNQLSADVLQSRCS